MTADAVARLRAVAESCSDFILLVTPEGRIEYLNRTYGRLPAEAYLGTNIFDLLQEPDASRLRGGFERVAKTGKVVQCELEYRHHDGALSLVEARVCPVLQQGRVTAMAVGAHDVRIRANEFALLESEEQLRRHQDELAHAGRLSTMGELVASIAHEINQPLYAIANYAGACQNALSNPSEESRARVAGWAREITHQARRAGAIITRLGDFVRKAPPHRSTLNMNNLVIDSLDLLRFEARRHQVRVGIELAPPAPLILADRIQIQQVIVNLIRNALDALEFVPPPNRRVAISINTEDARVVVHVEDGGKGLTADEHALLFEPFFTTKDQGMGMGLTISRSIIESHGGRLWATRNETAGATFHFELPMHPIG